MIYIFLADGFEDMEAIATFDILKRNGLEVKTIAVGSEMPKSAHGLIVKPDENESNIDFCNADCFVFPGGMPGANNLHHSKLVNDAIQFSKNNGIPIAAICAAPGIVLSGKHVLDNKRYTCFPGFQVDEGVYTGEKVTIDGNLITADGPYSVFDFANSISDFLKNRGKNV